MEAPTARRLVGNYELGETLGKGGYSWVKKGTDIKTGSVVALKFMTRADKSWEKEQAEQVRTEIKSMIQISSDHVMKLYAYNLNATYPQKDGKKLNTILLVLEYCPGGELFDILYYCQQLNAIIARTYFQQLCTGLAACHSHGVVHRDVKPQNLLMDAEFQLKITDFGLSYLMKDPKEQEEVMKTSYVGTRGYQAPELLSRKSYTKACDVFSAGVVLFILLTGYPPFDQAAKTDKWYRPLYKNDPDAFWKQHKGCGVPLDCQKLITRMLTYKPQDRATLEDVMAHNWYKEDILSDDQLKIDLKKMHASARSERMKDKKKIEEYRNSVKETKRETMETTQKLLLEKWGKPPSEPVVGMHAFELPKYEPAERNGKSVEAMIAIHNIFEYGDNWKTANVSGLSTDKPYEFMVDMQDNKLRKFRMQVKCVEVGTKHKLYVRRMDGNSLLFLKIYKAVEAHILASRIFSVDLTTEESVAPTSAEVSPPKEEEKSAPIADSVEISA